ncbi:anti-sigma factor [Roseiarcaceae bacterium H3SJ34-1]|uniref:anti-sigma factor family protein n=1 Tax=Terripilifer ovatus TaxID=3032367 RepID=UPI003AB93811|nr:anti-sigma factor [Roseiarcaceae bacterium H3SJ34-1]
MNDDAIDPRVTMQASLDGELDAAAQAAFERRLADDPVLAADYARHVALRRVLRTKLPREPAPAGLRARLDAMSGPAVTQPVRPLRRDFVQMAAALAVGLGLGGGATFLALAPRDPSVVEALITAHRRALLSGTPVDIASNDHHNVRPWFDARIAISPPAPDLAAQGYPLVGGRVDVIGGTPAPSLVYRLGAHIVSVTALPAASPSTQASGNAGFQAVSWRESGFTFWAVTDAERRELDGFVVAFKTAITNAPP